MERKSFLIKNHDPERGGKGSVQNLLNRLTALSHSINSTSSIEMIANSETDL